MKLSEDLAIVLAQMASTDDRIVVLDGDLADSDGAMHFAHLGPNRFLAAGIAEQNMVSVAAGLAEAGLRPWVFSFAAFLCFRAYDQTRVCLSQARQPVALVGSHAGGLSGRNGKTHTALNDLALMLTLPGMQVWAPADVADIRLAATFIQSGNSPAYIRTPRIDFGPVHQLPSPAGTTRWIRPRKNVTLVSTGLATCWAYAVSQHLEDDGLQVGVLHCPLLAPFPDLRTKLVGVEQIVVIEDHYRLGGLSSLILGLGLSIPLTTFCWPDDFSGKSGADEELLTYYGLSASRIADALKLQLSSRLLMSR